MSRLTNLKPRLAVAPTQRIRSHQVERMSSRPWSRLRAHVLSSHPLCAHCRREGRVSAATDVDHIVPLWRGGSNDLANLQPLCGPCHAVKTAGEAGERG
jgi:5-methylcytosine-specific restriction protein A